MDIVFVVDTTGSMGGTIDQVRRDLRSYVDQLEDTTNSFRVGVVSYRDFPQRTGDPSDYPARVDLSLSTDLSAIQSAINELSADGGGDIPETVFSGISTAIDLPWRPGVTKVAIVIGDAPPLSPEPISGLTASQLVARSLAVDPVEVIGVDVGNLARGDLLAPVTSGTGGTITRSDANLSTTISEVLADSATQPSAWAGGPYAGRTGTPVTFDASGSYDPAGGDLIEFRWDFEGDGEFDRTTATAETTFTYPGPFMGQVVVEVRSAVGKAIGSARVVVDDAGTANASDPVCDVDAEGLPVITDEEGRPVPCTLASLPSGDRPDVVAESDAVAGVQYVMVAKDGGVFAPGGRGFYGTARVRPGDSILRDDRGRIIGASGAPLESPVVAFAYTPTRRGYWLVQANGGVIPIGDAINLGDLRSVRLSSPIVGTAATRDGMGLYLVASDGGIFALGNAPFKGSLGGLPLNEPILGMGLDHDGSGYFLVASDGGVFAFDAAFRGSLGDTTLNQPIVGMAVAPAGGYVLAASDGGAFNYGTSFAGSLGDVKLVAPIVGIAADPDGAGYWMAGADGGAFAFDATFYGSVASILLNSPISGITAL